VAIAIESLPDACGRVMLSVAYPPSRYRPVRINAFVDYLRAEIPKTGAGIIAMA
jgi:DNA-binding transcriptional LysR family regulator